MKNDQRGIEKKKTERKGKLTVREHVRQGRELVMERCSTPDEPMDGDVDRTLSQPFGERVEQQLRTSVRVLLPSVQLIVGRKRDALLESTLGIGGPPNDISPLLQPHGHVEILRDVMF